MNERKTIDRQLVQIEQDLKELEIRYEQYFAGVEKREPIRARNDLARRLRRFANRHIVQTDLRFRYQNSATRFHSYCGHWDRILRLMDEGRYVRHLKRPQIRAAPAPEVSSESETDAVYNQLLEARATCKIEGDVPSREKVATFLAQQSHRIREKFGDRKVEFKVVTEDGKPKIKVRAKK